MKLIFSGINHPWPDNADQSIDRPLSSLTLPPGHIQYLYRPKAVIFSRFQSYLLLLLRGIWDQIFGVSFFVYFIQNQHRITVCTRSDNLPSTLHDKHPSPVRNHRKRHNHQRVDNGMWKLEIIELYSKLIRRKINLLSSPNSSMSVGAHCTFDSTHPQLYPMAQCFYPILARLTVLTASAFTIICSESILLRRFFYVDIRTQTGHARWYKRKSIAPISRRFISSAKVRAGCRTVTAPSFLAKMDWNVPNLPALGRLMMEWGRESHPEHRGTFLNSSCGPS